MKKLFYYKGYYGILDENKSEPRIYWINEDLSPEWSEYVHGQKSVVFSYVKSEAEFICELPFDYEHVTDLSINASLD